MFVATQVPRRETKPARARSARGATQADRDCASGYKLSQVYVTNSEEAES